MKTTLLLAAALTLTAGCASSGSARAPAGGAMGINDNELISTRMNTIEAGTYRTMLGSGHQIAGFEDKLGEMEQKARRDAERRKDYRRTVPHSF